MDRFKEPDEEIILGYCYYDKELYGGEDGYITEFGFIRSEDFLRFAEEILNTYKIIYGDD